jgi:FkbM family methyltransferase
MKTRQLQHLVFQWGYSLLPFAAKVKLLNAICAELRLQVLCQYTRLRLPLLAPNDGIIKALAREHAYWDQHVIEWVCRTIPRGSTVFDIGANVGFWTIPLALAQRRLGGGGRVLAFEPTPATLDILRANLRLNELSATEVTVQSYALGAEKETAELACFDGVHQSCGWNTLGDPKRLGPEAHKFTVTQVPVRPLDDVWREIGSPSVAFVKIDVEGFEAHVIRGGRNFFRAQALFPDFAAYSEINRVALEACGSSVPALFEAIRAVGLIPATIVFGQGERPDIVALTDAQMLALTKADILLIPPGSAFLTG